MRVAIVGGGAAGVATAWLLSPHHEVVLYESSAALGGHIVTLGRDGRLPGVDPARPLEAGVVEFERQSFHWFRALMGALDVRLAPTNLQTSLHIAGDGSWWSPGLVTVLDKPLRWKVRQMVRLVPIAWARAAFLRRAYGPSDLREQTLAAWLPAGAMGVWMRMLMTYAFSVPYVQTPDLPATLAVPTLARYLDMHLDWVHVTGGVATWVDAASRDWAVEVCLGTPVEGVERPPRGVVVHTAGQSRAFDAVVLATSPGWIPRLLTDPDAAEQLRFGAWRDAHITTLVHRDRTFYGQALCGHPSAFDLFVRDGDRGGYNAFLNDLAGYPREREWYALALYLDDEIDPASVLHRQRLVVPRYELRSFRHRPAVLAHNGHRHTWIAGAWLGDGLHEGAIASAVTVARALGGRTLHAVPAPPLYSGDPATPAGCSR